LPLLVIAFSFIVESGGGSAGRILDALGKPQLNTACTFAGLIATIAFCYWLIPLYQVLGAAMAFALSNIIKRLLMLACVLWLYEKKEKGLTFGAT